MLSDHVAQFMYPNRKETLQRFAAMGADYQPMLPLQPFSGRWRRPDLRNHRKLVVVDGMVGFTGSQNLVVDHYHQKGNVKRGLHWHELMVPADRAGRPRARGGVRHRLVQRDRRAAAAGHLAGPADRSTPTRLDAQMLPSGPSFDNDNNLKLFAALIHNARRRISITSPYYVPDETIQMALVTAGSRGLDVELFVVRDRRPVHGLPCPTLLLRAAAPGRSQDLPVPRRPTILHAKHLSIDDDVAVIGSSNLDIRSLSLHMEMWCWSTGQFTTAMRAVEDYYRSKSRQVLLEDWLQRPTPETGVRQPDAADVLAAMSAVCGAGYLPGRPTARMSGNVEEGRSPMCRWLGYVGSPIRPAGAAV